MIEIEIQIPLKVKAGDLIQVVEQVCSDNHLSCSLKGTLAKYSGCVHWHYKMGKEKGTLEITYWEKEHRLWVKVADHRANSWIQESIPNLKKQIESSLKK